jgi:hypothetical protein
MILIDEYNEWYRPSDFLSFRYANNKGYDSQIPPYDFAFIRLLMKFDGHLMKQGVKVCATTMTHYFNHKFDPKTINFPTKYDMNVENLKLNDLRNAIYFYMIHRLSNRIIQEEEMEYINTLTQGNWRDLLQDLKAPHRTTPSRAYWDQRKRDEKYYENVKY